MLIKKYSYIIFALIFLLNLNYITYGASWKELKEKNIVKQSRDYSCGASSLATILKYYYLESHITEDLVLELLPIIEEEKKDKVVYSLLDIANASIKLGYESLGLDMNIDDLLKLQIPAILFIKFHEKQNHFTVYKGFKDNKVHLADPSFGNIAMSIKKFKKKWLLVNKNNKKYGRALLVVPKDIVKAEQEPDVSKDFFYF
tara:strand:+ start:2020 stop:2622 length:603 start_codon:yes stop_codon:yes gene_type:complete